MAITQCTADTSAVSNLPDAPALTPAELKAVFDKGGTEIKNYINNTMIGDINTSITSSANTINATISANDTIYGNRMTAIEGDITTLQTSVSGKQKTISVGSTTPTGGSNGDIYIQYF